MNEVVKCKLCNRTEFFGEMRWYAGLTMCRRCYKADYEQRTGKLYAHDDLDGPFPDVTLKPQEES